MEQLILSFTRVQLGLEQASDVITRFLQLESAVLSGDMTISSADLLLLLDCPSPASITSSLAQLHSFSYPNKARLLHRAVHEPETLSSGEIDLLRRRFWPSREYDACHVAWAGALAKLESDTSEKHVVNTVERLQKVREKLAGDEEKAFEAAQREWVRRLMSATIVPKARWGYAVYYDADAGADNEDFKSA